MFNSHRIEHLDSIYSSSFFGSFDEHFDQGKTRIVWVTNYLNDDDFPIHVPIDDMLLHTSSNSSEMYFSDDLSKLNLNDLLFLLYQLQRKTTSNSVMLSNSTISSSSSSLDSIVRQPSSQPHTRQSSSFPLTNIADIPKQFMSTLIKPIPSMHSSHSKQLHSPNDVVNELLQSYHLRTSPKKSFRSSHSSIYTYQQSEQHKAKLISNLLTTNITYP